MQVLRHPNDFSYLTGRLAVGCQIFQHPASLEGDLFCGSLFRKRPHMI